MKDKNCKFVSSELPLLIQNYKINTRDEQQDDKKYDLKIFSLRKQSDILHIYKDKRVAI